MSSLSDSVHRLVVGKAEAGLRLDKFLQAKVPDLSRSYLQQLVEKGHLTRQGQTIISASTKVKPMETYLLSIPAPEPLALEPVSMNLKIVYEDDQLLVIDKPAGLSVHPAPGTYQPTLVHGLLAHCRDQLSGIGGVARPGIVHRIDKDTSGLLVVAKTDVAHQHLSAQLKSRTLKRTYLAICWGQPQPPEGSIEGNIGRSPSNRKKMAVLPEGGKTARTHYYTEEHFRIPQGHRSPVLASLVSCRLDTGRTHQIRVHMAHIGHALLGDPNYSPTIDNSLKKLGISNSETLRFLKNHRRQALHACSLTLLHPALHEQLSFDAALPDDLACLLNDLKHLHE